MEQCEKLRKYNRWRRGDARIKQPDPKELGQMIDSVADRLEVLERENLEFSNRLNEHLRVIEDMVLVLSKSGSKCDVCSENITDALKIAKGLGYGVI